MQKKKILLSIVVVGAAFAFIGGCKDDTLSSTVKPKTGAADRWKKPADSSKNPVGGAPAGATAGAPTGGTK